MGKRISLIEMIDRVGRDIAVPGDHRLPKTVKIEDDLAHALRYFLKISTARVYFR